MVPVHILFGLAFSRLSPSYIKILVIFSAFHSFPILHVFSAASSCWRPCVRPHSSLGRALFFLVVARGKAAFLGPSEPALRFRGRGWESGSLSFCRAFAAGLPVPTPVVPRRLSGVECGFPACWKKENTLVVKKKLHHVSARSDRNGRPTLHLVPAFQLHCSPGRRAVSLFPFSEADIEVCGSETVAPGLRGSRGPRQTEPPGPLPTGRCCQVCLCMWFLSRSANAVETCGGRRSVPPSA